MKLKLHWQILISMAAALVIGILLNLNLLNSMEGSILAICNFTGKMFFNALKMLVVPLIISSVICGMMGLGAGKNVGRLGLKTLAYYTFSGLIAIITGLILVNLIGPGIVDKETSAAIIGNAQDPAEFMQKVEGKSGGDFAEIFVRMIPSNVIDAATNNGQLLGVIFYSLLFGYFITRLPENMRSVQENFWQSFYQVMTLMADLVIAFAPIGVFALIVPVIDQTGFELFLPLLKFTLTVLSALAIHFLITLSLLLKFFGISPNKHMQACSPALLTAFSTASSASTLPVTIESVQKRAGVSKKICGFTLPLGATVNMDGTALYECVVVIFIAQIYGIEITLMTQFTIVVMALLTSIGVAGIPKASLVAIAVILGAVGLPIESIGIVLVVDRILDMCRTTVNVYSDTCGAAIIAKSEGEYAYPNPT